MNTPYYIAKRLTFSKSRESNFSKPIVSIAVLGIALGIAVMITSVAVVTGFKEEIRNKVIGFGSHVQILNFDSNQSYETIPINKKRTYASFVRDMHGVKHMHVFATKAGILKKNEEYHGVICKGVDNNHDWTFFENILTAGKIPVYSDTIRSVDILISQHIAKLLRLDVGDRVGAYFVQDPPRVRAFKVAGVYETGMTDEFDKMFIICDIQQIQRLNDWDSDLVTGWEVYISDFDQIEVMTNNIRDLIGLNFFENQTMLKVINVYDKYPQIFDWLNLLDMNVWIILILMLAVAGINMISGLLIIILEKTNMIGVLKAIGSENHKIRNIFMYQSLFLLTKGLFWGNLIGLGLCAIQHYFGVIALDPSSYYIDRVPIHFHWVWFILLNIGVLTATLLVMLIPSMIISKISPEKTIKFN